MKAPAADARVSVGGLLRGSGPRFARDAAGPVIAFYVGWKALGLMAGIAAGTAFALAAFWWERRRQRSGLGAVVGLGIAVVQMIVGLSSGTAVGYLAPAVIANGLYGLAFVVSVAIGRPLASVFAAETYPFPGPVRTSRTFQRTFSTVSLVWGATFLARAAFRLAVLLRGNVDVFIVVNVATGVPLNALLMVWSVWYGVRRFRQSAEWGPALAPSAPRG